MRSAQTARQVAQASMHTEAHGGRRATRRSRSASAVEPVASRATSAASASTSRRGSRPPDTGKPRFWEAATSKVEQGPGEGERASVRAHGLRPLRSARRRAIISLHSVARAADRRARRRRRVGGTDDRARTAQCRGAPRRRLLDLRRARRSLRADGDRRRAAPARRQPITLRDCPPRTGATPAGDRHGLPSNGRR